METHVAMIDLQHNLLYKRPDRFGLNDYDKRRNKKKILGQTLNTTPNT